MAYGNEATARDFMYLEEVRQAGSGLSQVRYSPERPSEGRDALVIEPEALEQALEAQKEGYRAQVRAQIAALEQQLANLPNHEGANDMQAQLLKSAIGSLDVVLRDIDNAHSFGALMSVSMNLTGALDRAQSIGGDARSEGMLQDGVLMAEKMQEYYEQYTISFRQELAAFNNYVDENGFAAAWDQFEVSYDNMGVAHAHLLQNDPEYASTIIKLDDRAEERKKEANADWGILEKIAAENGISFEDARKRLAGIDAQIAAARASGEDATLRVLEAQREQFIGQTATDIHEQTGDDRAKDLADNADSRWEAAMREREEAHRAFIRAAQAAGATDQQLAQYEAQHEARTNVLENDENLDVSAFAEQEKEKHAAIVARLAENEIAHRAFIRAAQAAGATDQQLAQYHHDYEARKNALGNDGNIDLSEFAKTEAEMNAIIIQQLIEGGIEERVAENGDAVKATEKEHITAIRVSGLNAVTEGIGGGFRAPRSIISPEMGTALQQAKDQGVAISGITVDDSEKPDIESAAVDNSKLPQAKPKEAESKTV